MEMPWSLVLVQAWDTAKIFRAQCHCTRLKRFWNFFEPYFSLKNGLINVIELQTLLASSNCSMFDRIQVAPLACYDFQNLFSNIKVQIFIHFLLRNVGPLKYRIGDHCQNLPVYKSMMICVLDNYTKKLKNIQWSFELVKAVWEMLSCDKFFKIPLEDLKVKFKKKGKRKLYGQIAYSHGSSEC